MRCARREKDAFERSGGFGDCVKTGGAERGTFSAERKSAASLGPSAGASRLPWAVLVLWGRAVLWSRARSRVLWALRAVDVKHVHAPLGEVGVRRSVIRRCTCL